MSDSQSRSTYHRVRQEVKALFRLPAAKIGPKLTPGKRYNIVSGGKVLLENCPAPMASGFIARFNLSDRPRGVGKARAVAL
jgi:hypothetical protein